ncbi:MAG TPA: ABC transporter permease [Ktedonobacteraceae bacterium]|nr:ABC transporter permease [Ktedonobacteraceae bacterium]
MTFYALLTKELRLRFRRERTVWVIVGYLLAMSLLGWITLSSYNNSGAYSGGNDLSSVGRNLYYMLSVVQLFLVIFVTPSFTATAINGEKERQTFDMLLCSRLSAFSLVIGKLAAGLVNAVLLIVASLPLFSLVFFFGGISPLQILQALWLYIVTALVLSSLGVFCSIIIKRPAISTAIVYGIGLLWVFAPVVTSPIIVNMLNGLFMAYPSRPQIMFIWNPLIALTSTYPGGQLALPGVLSGRFLDYGLVLGSPPLILGRLRIAPWQAYSALSLLTTLLLVLFSLLLVRSTTLARPFAWLKGFVGLPKFDAGKTANN